jgi:hypothetical protein
MTGQTLQDLKEAFGIWKLKNPEGAIIITFVNPELTKGSITWNVLPNGHWSGHNSYSQPAEDVVSTFDRLYDLQKIIRSLKRWGGKNKN